MTISPLKPAELPKVRAVGGARWASCAAGLRYRNRDDLTLLVFDELAAAAGVFTQSTTPGHPVIWCRKQIARGQARAVLINAGNAHVFRGSEGDQAVEQEARAVADALGCAVEDVLVASTGVIGERLPVEKIAEHVPQLVKALSTLGLEGAASAIMTTDTFPKWSSTTCEIDGREVTISGIAKGSGMIAPDMATMLSFVVTNAAVVPQLLQQLLNELVQSTFNAITVDSDTSTSDTLMLFATGGAGHRPIEAETDPRLACLRDALHQVLHDLALLVVRDGEGAQKLIEVECRGAKDNHSARAIARSIANSPLVKTAIAGEDANWGRVVMAIGKSGEPVSLDRIGIAFGGIWVARDGAALKSIDEDEITRHLRGREISISVDVGVGSGSARVWTCDLTHAYIDINADYRS